MRRPLRTLRSFALVALVVGAVACSSDERTGSSPTATVASAATAAPDDAGAATSAAPAGDAPAPAAAGDCTGVMDAMVNMSVDWQITIGLTNSATTEWGTLPIGTITKFGDHLAALSAAVGSDAAAAEAIAFMSGANDIVQRGIGGDAAAQQDLATYLGTDITVLVGKQIPIASAIEAIGCSA